MSDQGQGPTPPRAQRDPAPASSDSSVELLAEIDAALDEEGSAAEGLPGAAEAAMGDAEVAPDPAEVVTGGAKVAPDPAEVAPDPAEVVTGVAKNAPDPAKVAPGPAEDAPDPAEDAPGPAEDAPDPAEDAPDPAEVVTGVAKNAPDPAEEAPDPAEDAPDPAEEAPGPAGVATSDAKARRAHEVTATAPEQGVGESDTRMGRFKARVRELLRDPDDADKARDYSHLPPWLQRVRRFIDRHGQAMWWLHSLYALGLGVCVVMFAQKGFDYARWLILMMLAVWAIVLVLFRLTGSGSQRRIGQGKERARFFAMTYVLKNLYQGMLFFLLPFYWKAATFDSPNKWFVVLLIGAALLATLDMVFDRILMRWRALAAGYFSITLFAGFNIALASLLALPTLWCLMIAALFATLGFWTLHFDLGSLAKPKQAAGLGVAIVAVLTLAYYGRTLVPPVPLAIETAALGPETLEDGRLAMHVTSLHSSRMKRMIAVTDLRTPIGYVEDFVHVWRHEGAEVLRLAPSVEVAGEDGRLLRIRSDLEGDTLPGEAARAGTWSIDVETANGQLIGRVDFEVIE